MGKPAGTAGLQTGTAAAGRASQPDADPEDLTSSVKRLNARHREIWDHGEVFHHQKHSDCAIRTNRAISWMERAEQEYRSSENEKEQDVAFILYWIAFDALHGIDGQNSKEARSSFFAKVVRRDREAITALLQQRREDVSRLVNDRHLDRELWHDAAGQSGGADQDLLHFNGAGKNDPSTMLDTVFRPLYVLRNQLLHGAAKWKSSKNRKAVGAAANIMRTLIPIFTSSMLDRPQDDWGKPPYWPYRQAQQEEHERSFTPKP